MAAEGVEQAEKTFLLKSSDGLEFVISELEARQSMTLEDEILLMLDVPKLYGESSAIHLGVKSNILSKVIEYLRGSHASGGDPRWVAKFIHADNETLFDLILASHQLRVLGLLELTCRTLADMINGKSPQEILRIFNIKSGSTKIQDADDLDGICVAMGMVPNFDFEAHAKRDLTLEQKALKALHIVRCQDFTEYDPKVNDIMCTRFFSYNIAFFDLDEESRLGRGHQLHQIPSPHCKLMEESSTNVLSLKIRKSDVGFPINIFGTVIARDELDYKCVYLFRRESDDPQLISSPAETLNLIDPCRGLVSSHLIYFEINLKIKTDRGAIEDFSKGLLVFNSDLLTKQSSRCYLASWLSDVELACANVLRPVEATIAINVLKGRCNISRVEAWTTGNSEDHIILYDNKSAGTRMVTGGDGGSVPLTRRVVAVPFDEKVVLSLAANGQTEPTVLTLGVTDEVHACKIGCGEVQVKIAWTAMPKRKRYHNWEFIGEQMLLV